MTWDYSQLRRFFLTGLLVLVPIFITLYVLGAVVSFFSNTIIGRAFDTWANELIFKRDRDHLIPGFGLVATLVFILAAGIFVSTVGGYRLFVSAEHLLLKTPVINVIYPPAKQIIDFLLSPKGKGFSKVVLIEFPRKGTYSIGFLTGDAPESLRPRMEDEETRYISVFVPFAPAPMSGALMVVREDEIIHVDMSVEEAFRYIISAGVLTPGKEDETASAIEVLTGQHVDPVPLRTPLT